MVEERSDGTFAVTLEDGITGGLEASGGLKAGFHVGRLGLSIGGEVTAAVMARLGRGRTWIVGSQPRRSGSSRGRRRAAAGRDVGVGVVGLVGRASATGEALGESADVARAGIMFDHQAGWRVDRRSGHRTVYVQASATGSAAVDGSVLGLSGDGQETYAVEYDATGRPVDLQVIATGSFAGSRDLPAVVQPVAGLLATAPVRATGYEVTGHLDLTDAASLAAARGLLNAIADRRATAAPEQALRRRIDEHGTVQARVLATAPTRPDELRLHGRPGSFSADAQSSSAPSSCWPRPRAGSTANGSRGPTAWRERGRPPHVRTCVRVVRRAPLPFGLLVLGRRLAARGAGRGGAGARPSGAGADRPQLGLGVDGVRPGRVIAGLARRSMGRRWTWSTRRRRVRSARARCSATPSRRRAGRGTSRCWSATGSAGATSAGCSRVRTRIRARPRAGGACSRRC